MVFDRGIYEGPREEVLDSGRMEASFQDRGHDIGAIFAGKGRGGQRVFNCLHNGGCEAVPGIVLPDAARLEGCGPSVGLGAEVLFFVSHFAVRARENPQGLASLGDRKPFDRFALAS